MHDPNLRPNPDHLLAQLEAKATKEKRGRLKIFFGASPGVGKTYAMLSAARALQDQGTEVVAGVVETHGRSETALLLQHIEILPRRKIAYKGHLLEEFDLDAALQRKPGLLLVDELAHTNAQGSRHPKRWQDIEELIASGINVFTTVNVQHIESLNDVVSGISGIRVWERVPDHVIDKADEIVLVDLPPEELLQRLREGKVYMPDQAERALDHFFRKGNLLALRELALRRTADRVDGDVRAWRREKSVATVWPTRESVLVCVGPGPDSEKLVRRAARRANQTGAPWHAIAIETPAMHNLPDAARTRILAILKLAREMGGETASLAGTDPVAVAAGYAREYNLGIVLVGRDRYRRLPWQRSFAEKLGRLAPDLELLQIAREDDTTETVSPPRFIKPRKLMDWQHFLLTWLIVALVTACCTPLYDRLDLTNIAMIYLLVVVFTALRLGRGAAVLAAFLSVAAFDIFFVPPRFTFAVHDAQYLVTFAVMLTVALVVGQLTAGLRFQAASATKREQRIRALYVMSKELSSALSVEDMTPICLRFIKRAFRATVVVFIPDHAGQLQPVGGASVSPAVDVSIAQWSHDHGRPAGVGTDTLPSAKALYIPLKAQTRPCGLLALLPDEASWDITPEQQQLLDTSAALMAIALERIHDGTLARNAQVDMESERLRNALLSAISHDLRTPLTVITGLTDALYMASPSLSEPHISLVQTIREEVARTVDMVNNLLDMARMQLGHIVLNRGWQTLEEMIGLAMRHCLPLLARHTVHIDLPANLPLLEMDVALMERVFNNLLENAAKHTPAGSLITISAHPDGDFVTISLRDNGPGLPPGMEQKVFEKFTRGRMESKTAGFGLGLAIVRSIIEAHGGSVYAENHPEGGAHFILRFPTGTPPPMPEEM
ncbi:MAG: DUF4118 domain-containing protein [Magnetococcales bacterium]|nr:DUF4118 domain-containing protein [Magnetococcales bacterium]